MDDDEFKIWDRIAEETLHILSERETGNSGPFKISMAAFDMADAFIRERRKRIENQRTFRRR